MQAGQSSKTLTIAAPRDFTAKWLGSRLAAYGRSDPELRFVLLGGDDELDFTQANLDLAVRLGDGPGEHEGVRLGDGGFVVVAGAGCARCGDRCGRAAPTRRARPRWSASPMPASRSMRRRADSAAPACLRLLAEADLASGRVVKVGEVRARRARPTG